MKRRFTHALVPLIILAIPLPTFAFKKDIHAAMTSTVLRMISKTVSDNTYKYTDRAIDEIVQANLDTDCASCQSHSEYHFDSEDFDNASTRLVNLKNQILSDLSGASPKGALARKSLGQALHTLQDFYAHSTRVELGLSSFDNMLGVSALSGFPDTVQTCPTNAAVLGGAGLTGITSGYFPLPSPCKSAIPAGKCRHGNDEPFGGLVTTCDGINKDSPSRPHFQEAHDLAVAATQRYVTELILNDFAITNNAKAVKALMGVSTTLGMIIDTTGSMADIIDSVKANVTSIVNDVVGTPDEPEQYLLEPFNDPFVGPLTTTADAGTFLAQVNSLFASGGGDCPELAMRGLLEAVNGADPQSTLYLFTDASAKDSDLFPNVTAMATQKKIKIKYGLFGSCSPVDPGFLATAAATGGQVFVLNRFEAGALFNLVASELGPDPVTISHTAGTLTAGSQDFQFPVDSALTSLTVSASVDQLGAVVLTRPDGTTVSAADPGVSITNLSTGRIFLINAPQVGNWHLQVQGTGSYAVDIQGQTTLDLMRQLPNLHNVNFVILTGRLAHEGYSPIQGQPVITEPQTLLAELSGPASNISFSFVSEAGEPLQALALTQGYPRAAADDFVGTPALPAQPFRVMATGTDGNGAPFQRIYSVLFRPTSVKVTPMTFLDGLPPGLPQGKTVLLRYDVQNFGTAGTFGVVATDGRRYISSVTPTVLTLDSGATGTVTVTLNVPPSAPVRSPDAVTLVATSTADATVSNSAVQNFEVVGAFSFDGGGQRPKDVNTFLSYANPTDSPVTLPTGVHTFKLMLFYASTTIPTTFSATLNGVDITSLFHPQPGTFELVPLLLQPGRNVLVLSIDGTVSSGRVATDTDRLVFITQ